MCPFALDSCSVVDSDLWKVLSDAEEPGLHAAQPGSCFLLFRVSTKLDFSHLFLQSLLSYTHKLRSLHHTVMAICRAWMQLEQCRLTRPETPVRYKLLMLSVSQFVCLHLCELWHGSCVYLVHSSHAIWTNSIGHEVEPRKPVEPRPGMGPHQVHPQISCVAHHCTSRR